MIYVIDLRESFQNIWCEFSLWETQSTRAEEMQKERKESKKGRKHK